MLFPNLSITNFFDDPDEIVKLANTLDYFPSPTGNYPGVRSRSLHVIDPNLFHKFTNAVLANFYNKGTEIKFEAWVNFQKIPALHKDKNNVKNKGWIHFDDAVLAGLVYLNKKADLDSGTSLYLPKGKLKHDWSKATDLKVNLYLNGVYDKKEYEKEMKYTDNKFKKFMEFNNVYNTLICYDGQNYHKINNMNIGTDKDRLTLVFFINNITVDGTPITRVKEILNEKSI
jgi:hypothetical protein|tara:strand:+ start:289 stop:975 length:687 start_codon:yes stop_codon:yes gene_type:complete